MSAEPTLLEAHLEALAACLCAQIDEAGSPPPCFCGVMPGVDIAIDLMNSCDDRCGIAFVNVTAVYPSNEVGIANLTPGNCGSGIGFDINLGIFRCFPIEVGGIMPPPEELLEITRQQMLDQATINKAINCCDWISGKDFVVGQYTPQGPAGGAIGGIVPISGWIA